MLMMIDLFLPGVASAGTAPATSSSNERPPSPMLRPVMERNGIASLPISARVRTASESDDQNGLADGGREPGQGSGDGHADQHADPRPGTRSARPERHEDEQHRQPEHQHDREPDHDRPDLARTGAHHVRPEVGQLLDSGGQRNTGRHGCGSRSHNSSVQDLCTLVDA